MPKPGRIKEIANPDDPDTKIRTRLVEDIYVVTGSGPTFQRSKVHLRNDDRSSTTSRKVKKKTVTHKALKADGTPEPGDSDDESQKVEIEEVQEFTIIVGSGPTFQRITYKLDKDIENRKTHTKRVKRRDPDTKEIDDDTWFDIERIDKLPTTTGSGPTFQRQIIKLDWDDKDGDESVFDNATTDENGRDLPIDDSDPDTDFDPPWRLDPFQTIKNLQWGASDFIIGGGWLVIAEGPSNLDPDPFHVADYVALADPLPVHASFWKIYNKTGVLKRAANSDMSGQIHSGSHRHEFHVGDTFVFQDYLYGPSTEIIQVLSVALGSDGRIATGAWTSQDDVSVSGMQFPKLVNVYAKDGTLLWRAWDAVAQDVQTSSGTIFSGYDANCTSPNTMSFDSKGCLCIGGEYSKAFYTSAPNRRSRALVIKYSKAGAELWRHEDYDDVTPIQSTFRGISIDKDDNVVVSGPQVRNPDFNDDGPSTVSVFSDAAGTVIRRIDVPYFSSGQTKCDKLGNVLVFASDTNLNNKIFKFSAAGALTNTIVVDDGELGNDPAVAFDIGKGGKLYAATGGAGVPIFVKCFAASTLEHPASNPQLWSSAAAGLDSAFAPQLVVLGNGRVVISAGNTYAILDGNDGTLISSDSFAIPPGYGGIDGGFALSDLQRNFRKAS